MGSKTADRIMIIYAGRIFEMGWTKTVLGKPRHPYTKALISAVPQLFAEKQKQTIFFKR